MATLASHSCKPRRTHAYSKDLHWWMVWLREVQGFTLDKVAANLYVNLPTVHRVVKQFWITELHVLSSEKMAANYEISSPLRMQSKLSTYLSGLPSPAAVQVRRLTQTRSPVLYCSEFIEDTVGKTTVFFVMVSVRNWPTDTAGGSLRPVFCLLPHCFELFVLNAF